MPAHRVRKPVVGNRGYRHTRILIDTKQPSSARRFLDFAADIADGLDGTSNDQCQVIEHVGVTIGQLKHESGRGIEVLVRLCQVAAGQGLLARAVHLSSSRVRVPLGRSDGKRPSAIASRPAARTTCETNESTSAFAAVVIFVVASWNCLSTNGTLEPS